jgi:hypothetical protein
MTFDYIIKPKILNNFLLYTLLFFSHSSRNIHKNQPELLLNSTLQLCVYGSVCDCISRQRPDSMTWLKPNTYLLPIYTNESPQLRMRDSKKCVTIQLKMNIINGLDLDLDQSFQSAYIKQ